jgi:hypothetical protein
MLSGYAVPFWLSVFHCDASPRLDEWPPPPAPPPLPPSAQHVCSYACSEEIPEPVAMGGQGYSVAFDPLDGSSVIDTNFSVGTIFGVWPGDSLINVTGRDQVRRGLHVNSVAAVCLREARGRTGVPWVRVRVVHGRGNGSCLASPPCG